MATAPRLQIISPLAEGADRIVAHAALDLGADVIVLLPFGREEYTHDFLTRESRAEFQALIDNATEVVELDGQRDTEKSKKLAYTKV